MQSSLCTLEDFAMFENIAIAGFLGHCFGMTFDDSMDSNMEKHITQMSWQYIQAQTSNSEDDVPFPKVLFMADIRRSPVEVGSLSHYLQWFLYIHSVVVWNFWTINSRRMWDILVLW